MEHRALRLVRWRGGKGKIWKWIVDNLPSGKIYVEPFGGGASVLLNKPTHPVEVYNDINNDLVNLFRAVRDEQRFEKLKKKLEWTLYSREEFRQALEILQSSSDPDERAWAIYVACNQSLGGNYRSVGQWGRAFTSNSNGISQTCAMWQSGLERLEAIKNRLSTVQIDNRDGIEVIKYWDTPETVFYIDPPYPSAIRVDKDAYRFEMNDQEHINLINTLKEVKGNFVVSSYRNEIYDELLNIPGVRVIVKETIASGAGRVRGSKLRGDGALKEHVKRIEALYIKG